MPKIEGIPTIDEFRKSVGRYGLRKRLKKADPYLDFIFSSLQVAQRYRGNNHIQGLEVMRQLRKRCILWLTANRGRKRWELDSVKNLGNAADRKLLNLISIHCASTPATLRRMAARRQAGLARDAGRTTVFGKAVGSSYHDERFTKNHLPGVAMEFAVEQKYRNFKRDFPKSRLTREDYVNHVLIPDCRDDPSSILLFGRTTRSASALEKGVKYCNAVERLNYRLNFPGNGLVLDAEHLPFHTGGMHTNKSGKGWAIFVVDFDVSFYAGPHSVDEFHHSSFLAGDAVASAGEIAVDDGTVVGVTNKTGHYKAGPAELHRALLWLQSEAGVDMSRVAVSDPFRAEHVWRRGTDVIAARGDFNDQTLKNAEEVPKPSIEEFVIPGPPTN